MSLKVGGGRRIRLKGWCVCKGRQRDAISLTLRMEEEAVNQEVWAASRSWRRNSLLESPERNPALLTLQSVRHPFSVRHPLLTGQLLTCRLEGNKLCCLNCYIYGNLLQAQQEWIHLVSWEFFHPDHIRDSVSIQQCSATSGIPTPPPWLLCLRTNLSHAQTVYWGVWSRGDGAG